MTSFFSNVKEAFNFIYRVIDKCLDEGFNYYRLVFTFNPEYFAHPELLPQAWIRKETLVLMMFSSRFHALVIGPPGIGKTTITDFLYRIDFPFARCTLITTESGSATTAAGLRDTIIELSQKVIKEFVEEERSNLSWIPNGILHAEEYLRCSERVRDILKTVMAERRLNITLSRIYKERMGLFDTYFCPINVYADANPPKADTWLGPDFNSRKEQLKPLVEELANIRRFSVIIICDDYDAFQKALIAKYKEFIKTHPHDALLNGEFYDKYMKFVFERRKIKVKYTEIPIKLIEFFMGLDYLYREGKLLLPISYGDYAEKVFGIAEAFARIKGHREITEDDWRDVMYYYQRVVETLGDITKTSKEYIFREAIREGQKIIDRLSTKTKEDFLKKLKEEVETKYEIH